MNYAIAKELKDAGFDQREQFIEMEHDKIPCQGIGYHLLRENADSPNYDSLNDRTMYLQYWSTEYLRGEGAKYIVYIPTLSELIAACGEYICLLQLPKEDGWVAYWSKEPFQKLFGLDGIDVFMEMQGNGATPEEAVARLWLALKRK